MTASEKAAAIQGSRSEVVFEEVQYRSKEQDYQARYSSSSWKIQSGDQQAIASRRVRYHAIHDAPHQIAESRSDVKIDLPVPLPS